MPAALATGNAPLHKKVRHRFFLLVGRCFGGASAASISSMLGKLPLSASGSFSTSCVSQSATPIGLRWSRSAYSTTSGRAPTTFAGEALLMPMMSP